MRKFLVVLLLLVFCSTIVLGASGDINILNEVILSGDKESDFIENGIDIISKLDGENIMLAGDVVNAEGTAEDLIILAGDIVNSDAIGEYGFMAANSLNISGDVLKDNFIAGNTINVTGDVGRDAYLLGSIINIDGKIGRNIYAFADEINIDNYVGGNIFVECNKIFISSNSVISGDVEIEASYIEIEEGAKINGVVTYNSNVEEVIIPQNVENNSNEVVDIVIESENVFLAQIKNIITWILINIVLFVATMLISPGLFEKIEKTFEEKGYATYGTSIGWGIILFIIIPIIAIIALITVLDSAVGFAGILAYIVILVYSTVITGYLIGTNLFINTKMNKYLVGIIGTIIIEIMRNLPIVGGLISFIVIFIGFGMTKEIMKKGKIEKEV